ncbi:hypothetical protein [Polyangium fumosum]|uniref:Uncharacterized protein n=1 Tax=Polyangium fumosum TaxID=889272 RepID=A0A4U1J7N3_9BACT|nr:hypothetical protein [Polyangium fumosum]TKD03398.1 hypothetical protein E8A74_25885 [Polyangium fumosum]
MTNRTKLELRVHRIIDGVIAKRQMEDRNVELKSEWPRPEDSYRTARQLAGHANAARGEPIIWIIGVNERNRSVCGAATCDVAGWYLPLRKLFDGEVAPDLMETLVVPHENTSVVVVQFDTGRAPYVTKVPPQEGCNCPRFEVPYRSGNSTNPARREDLLRILEPMIMAPGVDFLTVGINDDNLSRIEVTVAMYVAPVGAGKAVIPTHRCALGLRADLDGPYTYARDIRLRDEFGEGISHPQTPHLIVNSGARIRLDGVFALDPKPLRGRELQLAVTLGLVAPETAVNSTHRLTPDDRRYSWEWVKDPLNP